MSPKAIVLVTGALILSACATNLSRNDEATAGSETGAIGELEALAARMPGRYGAARRLDEESPGVQMTLSARFGDNSDLLLELREERESRQRGFILALERVGPSPFIPGRFIPLQSDGTASARGCRMRFRLRGDVISGETDPAQCRFGTGEQAVGLLKEIALDGSQIVIADQLSTPGGDADAEPDILRLHRLGEFRGQVRVRDRDGSGWRTAERMAVDVGGRRIEPVDAAGMSLGILVGLDLIAGQQPGEPLLYLQVTEARTGQVLGQSWGEPQAARIGLALERVQVDLERRPPRR